jgi:CheY-like chemotaxis protein
LENALLNLALNARDAMPGGGRLSIEAMNTEIDLAYARRHDDLQAGPYVMLAISDTGVGMTDEIKQRVFEPFFTTKPDGRGTGLGLSMVYGFVKQTGGHISLYSEVGHGTTIKIYLPRGAHSAQSPGDRAPDLARGGGETILVVEDDAEVRETVIDLLVALGYKVLEAADAQTALHILHTGVAVDLLFTDVVMPGPLRSPDLARLAKAQLPDLVVLFTSGYTDNAIMNGGRLEAGVHLLSKPYQQSALAHKLRQLLDAKKSHHQRSESNLRNLPGPRSVSVSGDVSDQVSQPGHGRPGERAGSPSTAHAHSGKRDILFTDVTLPGMDGISLAHAVQQRLASIHIVIASGYGSSIEKPAALRHASVLTKPFSLEALERALESSAGNLIDRSSAQR